jgi:hypothetical protein
MKPEDLVSVQRLKDVDLSTFPSYKEIVKQLEWPETAKTGDVKRTYNAQRKIDAFARYIEGGVNGFRVHRKPNDLERTGLYWHLDRVGFVSIQIKGTVQWLFDPKYDLKTDTNSDKMFSKYVTAGETLWVPSGLFHRVKSIEYPRLHFTWVWTDPKLDKIIESFGG